MTRCEIAKFETLDDLFCLVLRGLDEHLEHDVPDKNFILNPLLFLQNALYETIESCKEKSEKEDSISDFYKQIREAYDRGFSEGKASQNSECAE